MKCRWRQEEPWDRSEPQQQEQGRVAACACLFLRVRGTVAQSWTARFGSCISPVPSQPALWARPLVRVTCGESRGCDKR